MVCPLLFLVSDVVDSSRNVYQEEVWTIDEMAKILDISTEGVVVFDYIPTDSAVDSYPLVVISADSDVISTTPLKIGSCYAMQPGGIDYEVPESLGVVGVVVQ